MTRPTNAPPFSEPAARQPRDQLEEADRLRQQGKLDRAETICNALMRRYPDYVAALHTLGLVYLDKRNFGRALDCLVRASMLDPSNWMTLTALSLAYLRLGANEMAAQTLKRALVIRPQDASIFASLGEVHRDEHEYEVAQQAYRQALTLDPNLESAVVGLALCLSAIGETTEAAALLEKAFKQGHRSFNLLNVMTALPARTISIDLLGALDWLAARQSEPHAELKNTFVFARAAALDLVGRHAEAWQNLVAANRPLAIEHRAALKADLARRENALGLMRRTAAKAIEPSAGGEKPISLFILGPSRSGKTSLERLVASLDRVKAGYEVPIVENAVRRTLQAAAIPASDCLEELPPALLPAFRDGYHEELTRRARTARVFTSTLPNRIYDAAILANTIPNVRFLLMKRGSDDVVWRIYMTKYRRGNPYAYDLKTIRDYLKWYDTMIDLVAEKFPQIARVVTYERMVEDPTAALRAAGDLCGLPVKNDSPPLPNDRGCAVPYLKFMAEG